MRIIDLGMSHFRRCKNREDFLQAYLDWNEEVRRNVPSERLLVFNVKEGWAPLCRFLGKEIPDVPFPHANDSVVVHQWIRNAHIALGVLYFFIVAIAVVVVALLLGSSFVVLGKQQ